MEEEEKKAWGEGRDLVRFKMSVENESWGPGQGEMQRRNTSG